MSNVKINVSTELMKNYKQTELMSPEKKFEALQTDDGHSLLFSIGTDDVFYVTRETPEHTFSGWEKAPMSASGQTVKNFDAAQDPANGTIGLAMVVSGTGNDELFLCLGNSSSDPAWLSAPVWSKYSFDAENSPKSISIANVVLSETSGNKQYIVVDILRDPESPEKLISRYYIDTKATHAWQPHDVSIDIEADGYQSCLGRQHRANSPHQPTIDGLYTFGVVTGAAQFTFQPLYNVFDKTAPATPAKLHLPGDIVPDAMAACRKSDLSTDLYVCSQGALYFFASDNQDNDAIAVKLFDNDLFTGVKKMYSAQSGTNTVVWGLSGSDQVFYTTCPAGLEASVEKWSLPVPIAAAVDMFSPYLNRLDHGNTFFAVAGSTLQKLTKSTDHTIWRSQSVTLPSPDTKNTQKYSSYTTRILVTDENNKPLPNEQVTISSKTRTPVYINHLYYVIDSKGIQVKTDQIGTITVVEWITGLTGAQLDVTDSGGNKISVNPMDKPFGKIAQLNTKDSLKNATLKDWKTGRTTPLVDSGVSDPDLEAAAGSNKNLGTVYNTIKPSGASRPAFLAGVTGSPGDAFVSAISLDSILVDAGDLFRWLESGVEALIDVVEDTAKGVWNFVAHIAGKVYSCVLDAVEHVVAAAVWVFDQIKTGIDKLIQFLEFLFEWDDILTTHNVIKNVFVQWVDKSLDSLNEAETDIVKVFETLKTDVANWAGIPNFPAASNGPPATSAFNGEEHGAPANLGTHHYQGNAASASASIMPPSVTAEIFTDLLDAMKAEEDSLKQALNLLQSEVIDQFSSLPITEIMKRFVSIVAEMGIDTVENVLTAAVKVFATLVNGLKELMSETIDIPVLSWLYNEITGAPLSFLDLICLVSAIPATILYKIVANKAPFPKGDALTGRLTSAASFEDVCNSFFSAPRAARAGFAQRAMALDRPTVLDDDALKTFAFVTGIVAYAGSIVLITTTLCIRGLEADNQSVPIPKTLALVNAIANVAYVSPNIPSSINPTNDPSTQVNNILTGISIVKGFVNIPLSTLSDSRLPQLSASVETILNIVWNIPVINTAAAFAGSGEKDKALIVAETMGNLAFNFGGMLELVIFETTDIKAKAVESAAQFLFMGFYGGCMLAAGTIDKFWSDPN